jgi:hypothetical protein
MDIMLSPEQSPCSSSMSVRSHSPSPSSVHSVTQSVTQPNVDIFTKKKMKETVSSTPKMDNRIDGGGCKRPLTTKERNTRARVLDRKPWMEMDEASSIHQSGIKGVGN